MTCPDKKQASVRRCTQRESFLLMNSRLDQLAKYSAFGHQKVDGWLLEVAIALIISLDRAQQEYEVKGNICEIGVHHGRLFILLDLLTREGENALAIDVFSEQHLNYDQSGKGDRDIFLNNIDTHVKTQANLRVVQSDSSILDGSKIIELAGGEIRLFSIDGSHTKEMTYHDLTTASHALTPGGIIILDDYFNEAWPGVSEGAHHFFADNKSPLVVPFAVGGNKVFLTTPSMSTIYRDWLFNNLVMDKQKMWFKKKHNALLGYDVFGINYEYTTKYEFLQLSQRILNGLKRKLKL